jgi:AraC-like DNA-binding protein
MQRPSRAPSLTTEAEAVRDRGLFRREALAAGSAETVTNLFAHLKELHRGQLIAEHPERHLQGTSLHIERTEGHGTWELYRLGEEFYVVAGNGTYEQSRVETVPGEGFVEFHFRLSGTLELRLPKVSQPVTVTGPCLLILHQAEGLNVVERVAPNIPETGVSLFCKPEFLARLAHSNGISNWTFLDEIAAHPAGSVWHRLGVLPPSMLCIARSLLENPYRRAIRLINAEAKALELLCEILAQMQHDSDTLPIFSSDTAVRQLENARRLMSTHMSQPLRLNELAKAVGMSESTLKRAFKSRYGVTVFDYGMECRMLKALELLKSRRTSVGQVAYQVGYRHQTSFTAAFQAYFGFLPSRARTEMH